MSEKKHTKKDLSIHNENEPNLDELNLMPEQVVRYNLSNEECEQYGKPIGTAINASVVNYDSKIEKTHLQGEPRMGQRVQIHAEFSEKNEPGTFNIIK